jgi:hypothetical protein
MFRSSRYQ